MQGSLCVVLFTAPSAGLEDGALGAGEGQVVLRVSDQVGPRITTHLHSDQAEAMWLAEFDQLTASVAQQPDTDAGGGGEHKFFEAQMRNTQGEVVVPLEVAFRTARWRPSFSFVHDVTLSDALPDEHLHQESVRL